MEKIKSLIIKYREIILYLIVGFLTTLISLAVYYLCTATVLDPNNPFQLQVANVISWVAAVVFAFFTNRIFVFRSKSKKILKEAVAFFLARIGSLLMDMAMMFVMVSLIGMNDRIAKVITQVAVIILNYVLSKFFVFKK